VFSIDAAHALDAFRHPFAYADRVFGAEGIPRRRRPAADGVQLGSR